MSLPLRALITAGGVLAFILVSDAALASDPIHSFEREFEVEGVEELSIDVLAGEVTVDAADVDRIRVVVDVRCNRGFFRRSCERRADRVDLSDRRRGDRLHLEIEGLKLLASSGVRIHTIVTLPASLDVVVDLGIGEVAVSGVQGRLYVDLGIGEVSVTGVGGEVVVDAGIGEVRVEVFAEKVNEVRIDLGIGQSTLVHPDGRLAKAGVLGSENEWSGGAGTHEVVVDLGIGEAEVVVR